MGQIVKRIGRYVKQIDRDLGFSHSFTAFDAAHKSSVNVGWFDDKQHDEGVTMAQLGMIHEYGVPNKNIPARPTIGPVHDIWQKKYRKMIEDEWKKILKGKSNPSRMVAASLLKMGQRIVNDTKRYMTDSSHYVELSARTIAARVARGRGGTKPLIDTGALRNGVEVRLKLNKKTKFLGWLFG